MTDIKLLRIIIINEPYDIMMKIPEKIHIYQFGHPYKNNIENKIYEI